ncbi:MAG: hypothetical protein M1826_000568 [Phylliscum demangeonii]|nr:MAG: hypothetical protein M1826_000568 [Phylliscum demangeonii]
MHWTPSLAALAFLGPLVVRAVTPGTPAALARISLVPLTTSIDLANFREYIWAYPGPSKKNPDQYRPFGECHAAYWGYLKDQPSQADGLRPSEACVFNYRHWSATCRWKNPKSRKSDIDKARDFNTFWQDTEECLRK